MPSERCTRLVLDPVDRSLKLGNPQTAEDVKVKTRTGAFCTCPRSHEFHSTES